MMCPRCESEMYHIEDERDVGITGGWLCKDPDCDYFITDMDLEIGNV